MRDSERLALFLLVCVPVRIGLAFLAKRFAPEYPLLATVFGFGAAAGFLYQYVLDRSTGFFGGVATWRGWPRLAHAGFFLAFGLLAMRHDPRSYMALLADVAFGAAHHLYIKAQAK